MIFPHKIEPSFLRKRLPVLPWPRAARDFPAEQDSCTAFKIAPDFVLGLFPNLLYQIFGKKQLPYFPFPVKRF